MPELLGGPPRPGAGQVTRVSFSGLLNALDGVIATEAGVKTPRVAAVRGARGLHDHEPLPCPSKGPGAAWPSGPLRLHWAGVQENLVVFSYGFSLNSA